MYPASFDTPRNIPLDFNTPPRTESVADALVSEPAPHEGPRAPAPESLLAEIGLPPYRVRQLVAERSAPSLWE